MKFNEVLHKKLLLQAEEAKQQGLTKLANCILNAIGSVPENEDIEYAYEDMQDHIHKDLWKAAAKIFAYYDMKSVNVEKLNETILACAENLTNEIEQAIDVADVIKGPFEPKIFGEK